MWHKQLLHEKNEDGQLMCPCQTAVCLAARPILSYNGPHQIVPDLVGSHKTHGSSEEKGYAVSGGSRLMSSEHNTQYVLWYYNTLFAIVLSFFLFFHMSSTLAKNAFHLFLLSGYRNTMN
tara:strand:- start:76 stop:435 length:360 start_codon:yes stop_codon:yes gene_type:complete